MTGPGKASLGAALMETGERERGLRLIEFAWSRYNLDPLVQERFVSRYGSAPLDSNNERSRKLLMKARARQLDDPVRSWRQRPKGRA